MASSLCLLCRLTGEGRDCNFVFPLSHIYSISSSMHFINSMPQIYRIIQRPDFFLFLSISDCISSQMGGQRFTRAIVLKSMGKSIQASQSPDCYTFCSCLRRVDVETISRYLIIAKSDCLLMQSRIKRRQGKCIISQRHSKTTPPLFDHPRIPRHLHTIALPWCQK